MKQPTFETITWSRVEKLTKILTEKILDTKKDFDSISTISRGGLVPARLLADHLGINKILVDSNTIPHNSLFVDDIFDSGNTFKKIITKVKDPDNFVYATLFARRGKQLPKQVIYAEKTKGNEYVVYPWDKLEFYRLKKLGL